MSFGHEDAMGPRKHDCLSGMVPASDAPAHQRILPRAPLPARAPPSSLYSVSVALFMCLASCLCFLLHICSCLCQFMVSVVYSSLTVVYLRSCCLMLNFRFSGAARGSGTRRRLPTYSQLRQRAGVAGPRPGGCNGERETRAREARARATRAGGGSAGWAGGAGL